MYKNITLFFLCSVFYQLSVADCGSRFLDSSFAIIKHGDLQFGSNYDNKNQLTNLLLDVYEPLDDTAAMRPLMIFVHGGSFIGGSRQDQRIDLTAEYFAQKGYVSANIEYRVEQTILISPYVDFADKDAWYKAMIRASHDLKAAIRYFKKDVAVNGNTYKIDTNRIIIYGSSAGAISVLNTVFIDDTAEMSIPFKRNIEIMGGFDGNSGNPGYTLKGIKAVVSCSGALDNVNYLNNNTDIAYIAFHNNPDLVVPFDIGCFTTVFCHLGTFYGDNRIYNKAHSLNMKAEFYPVNYLSHPVDETDQPETHKMILDKTSVFLYDVLCNERTTSIKNNTTIHPVEIIPNPNNGKFNVQLPGNISSGEALIKIYSVTGSEVYHSLTYINSIVELNKNIPNGMYFIEIQVIKENGNEIYLSKVSILR